MLAIAHIYRDRSIKQSKIRFSQHFGLSFRTGEPLNNPPLSTIKDHINNKKHFGHFNDFKIIDSCNNESDLRLLESLYLLKDRPSLNNNSSAVPLSIF